MGEPDGERLEAMAQAFLAWVRERIASGHYFGWFATDDDEVVAGVGMVLIDWPPHVLHLEPNRAFIFNVFTEPSYRRRGIARALIESALDEARRRRLAIVSLHASETGKSLYASLGFETSNEMQWTNHFLDVDQST